MGEGEVFFCRRDSLLKSSGDERREEDEGEDKMI